MAGYIGTKAVLLSTTAASVTGNADIGGNLTVDTNTLFVDSTNNRVGVGTVTPSQRLHISSTGNTFARIDGGASSTTGLLLDNGDGALYYDAASNFMRLDTNGAERMRIDSSGNLLAGTTSLASGFSGYAQLEVSGTNGGIIINSSNTGATDYSRLVFTKGNSSGNEGLIRYNTNDYHMAFWTAAQERMRIDASGNLLVGKTSSSVSVAGFMVEPEGDTYITVEGINGRVLYLNRLSSDGTILQFAKDTTTVGVISSQNSGDLAIGQAFTGFLFNDAANNIIPFDPTAGTSRDNIIDLGSSSDRFDDIYATNGLIQTSDANEKQQIAELTAAEMQAAKAISKLFKTFKWNDSVAEKGDDARIHTGVIAQEVEAAMTAAGLDAGRYAFFISSTWWESTEVIPAVEEVLDEENNVVTEAQPERTVTHTHDTAEEAPAGAVERTRKGIRYPQLLSFIGAATEQRLASIEARLDALETV